MTDEEPQKTSIFKKVIEFGDAFLDAQIQKSRTSLVMNQSEDAEDLIFGKAVTEDPSYAIHSQGWKEKPNRLQNAHLKMMSHKDSLIAAIIQTRQNQVSNYSKYSKSEQDRGWMLKLRNEEELLQQIKEDIKSERKDAPKEIKDADYKLDEERPEHDDDEAEAFNWELERQARARLEETYKEDLSVAKKFILECGVTPKNAKDAEDLYRKEFNIPEDEEVDPNQVEQFKPKRTFHAAQWDFDSTIRAWVRDTLTYDLYATEIVPNRDGTPGYFYPVDGGTIKYSSNRFKDYKDTATEARHLNILYPDQEVEAMERQKVLDLDQKLLDQNAYKWVQVIRGRVERAYTSDELKVGIRNPTTDIYNNGYGVAELELVVGLVTGHLNAEFYNQAYFTQGFSAKGILHIKAAINRRKLEMVRQQWQHMLKGARNSFQTPIFAGVDEVEWIPLTQKHDDIGFEGWMRYLIKMVCSIYQIDPHELGIPFKEEGNGNAGLTGDSTKDKMNHSKDRGLYPLLRHLQCYINENILKPFDDRFILCFTGVDVETKEQSLERQEKEVKFKKTVNEVRLEDGLPPLPGMDDIILDPVYLQWYAKFSEKGRALLEYLQSENMMGGDDSGDDKNNQDKVLGEADLDNDVDDFDGGDVYHDIGMDKSQKIHNLLKVEYLEAT